MAFITAAEALKWAMEIEENGEAFYNTVLQAAMGFEKDTLLFFYDLREMVSEAERETVSRIILEEKAHLRRLAKML